MIHGIFGCTAPAQHLVQYVQPPPWNIWRNPEADRAEAGAAAPVKGSMLLRVV